MHASTRTAALLAFAALALACAGCERAERVLPAEPEMVRESVVRGTNPVDVEVPVVAGARYVARLTRFDFDGALTLLDAQGREALRVRDIGQGRARDYAYWTAAATGAARIRVLAVEAPPRSARFRLEVFRLVDDAAARDVRAFESLTAASAVSGDADAVRRAGVIAAFEAAASAWSERDAALASDASFHVASIAYAVLDDWPTAMAAVERAIVGYARAPDPIALAHALSLRGQIRSEFLRDYGGGDAPQVKDTLKLALADFERARATYRERQMPAEAALQLSYSAVARYLTSQVPAAIELMRASESELEAAGAVHDRAGVLASLTAMRSQWGDYTAAARDYDRLLPLFGERRDDSVAVALNNAASNGLYLGDFARSLDRYVRAIEIGEEVGADRLVASARVGLGVTHLLLGQPDVARVHLETALASTPPMELNMQLVAELRLADALRQTGDTALAHVRLENLERIGREAAPLMRARIAVALGDDEAAAGHARRAIERYSSVLALGLPDSLAIVSRALVRRARAHERLGDRSQALADLERAAALSEANGNREEFVAATADRAEIAAAAGDRRQALAYATRAVEDMHKIMAGAADPDSRVTLAARLRRARELRVALLAQESIALRAAGDGAGADQRALDALLATDAANPPAGPGRAAGASSERDRLLASLAERRYRLQSLGERHAKATPEMVALEREVAMLRSRLTQLASEPARAERATSAPRIDLARLQRRLAMHDALVVYSLGADASWVWVVTRTRFALTALPRATAIERSVGTLLDAAHSFDASGAARRAAARLAAEILPPAAEPSLRRLVVPDGALGAVPWSLVTPPDGTPVVQLASLEPLLTPRWRETRWPDRGALRLALFGDPVFDDGDARLVAAERNATRGARRLARLPGTAREVAAIAALAPAGTVQVATGTDATRARLLSLQPGSADVLHLATHATLDTAVPALAALVMSRRDAAGHAIAGDVRPDDVLAMRAAPKLVVLSACDAAAEPSRSAAGLMNLTRAFLASGAQYVVSSRWAVSDESAVALMTEFYRALLIDRVSPELALARAQAALAGTPRWSAPFHWAGFVVTGAAP